MPDEVEVEVIHHSVMGWVFASLGWGYLLLLPLAALTSFVLALIIVLRGRGPTAGVALLLVVHVPLLIGIFAALQGAISSFLVVATSASTPRPSDLATGISTALVAPLIALLLTIPAYATAALGAVVRCLKAPPA